MAMATETAMVTVESSVFQALKSEHKEHGICGGVLNWELSLRPLRNPLRLRVKWLFSTQRRAYTQRPQRKALNLRHHWIFAEEPKGKEQGGSF